jgi:hypothetical protein
MKLDSIVTLASPEVRLRFIAMERSLRATGCNLPLRVIPYSEGRFDLPPNAEWWQDLEMTEWLKSRKAHPAMRKCQCLTIANFQFVDADVIFLRNPAEVLRPLDGFVTSCGHWRNTGHTVTQQSLPIFACMSTMWQKWVFNSGQWACDRILYAPHLIYERCESTEFKETCLSYHNCDQPGMNLLVLSSGVPVHNLTLPPWNMQSSWAGDYPGEFRQFWKTPNETPYLIHWAGCRMEERRPIDCLMEEFLTPDEKKNWALQVQQTAARREAASRSFRGRFGRLKRACSQFLESLQSA